MTTYSESVELPQIRDRGALGQKGVKVQTSEHNRETSPKDAGALNSVLGVKKLFSSAQIFAFSLTYMATWETMSSWATCPPPSVEPC